MSQETWSHIIRDIKVLKQAEQLSQLILEHISSIFIIIVCNERIHVEMVETSTNSHIKLPIDVNHIKNKKDERRNQTDFEKMGL